MAGPTRVPMSAFGDPYRLRLQRLVRRSFRGRGTQRESKARRGRDTVYHGKRRNPRGSVRMWLPRWFGPALVAAALAACGVQPALARNDGINEERTGEDGH